MSVMTSRSRPRSILIESGTVTPAILLKVSMKVSVAISPMGRFRISQGTLHLVSRARAAGPEARGPRATVPMLLPARIKSATVVPPAGYMWYLPVWGPFSTLEVSGNMMMDTPNSPARRLISSMSHGST